MAIPAVAANSRPAPQFRPLLGVLLAAAVILAATAAGSVKLAALFVVGIALGVSLYHASFGFTGAYRRAILEKDISGVTAQAVMLGLATLLFAPALAAGEIFGHGAFGAVAPVSVAMLFGAFVFGIGMQLGGGCASGALFVAGGGDMRLALTLVFFCIGCWLATLNMAWWRGLPSIGALQLGREIGFGPAAALQIAALAAIVWGLKRIGGQMARPLWTRPRAADLLRGPWPLLLGAVALAFLNWATLAISGGPWGVTWGFTIWGAKAAQLLGWDPSTSAYWTVPWRAGALAEPLLAGVTSVMNFGILLGAAAAATLAARMRPDFRVGVRPTVAAIVGGLLLGYGARLAYGCNIGAFFSGVASTSLHGWAWIVAALAGNLIGVRLRPWFRL